VFYPATSSSGEMEKYGGRSVGSSGGLGDGSPHRGVQGRRHVGGLREAETFC